MSRSDRLPLLVGLVVAVGIVAGLLLLPDVVERSRALKLELVSARVLFDLGDGRGAVEGPVEIAPGQPFTLHAVLEALEGDETIYFTEAREVTLESGRVAPERLRVWEHRLEARILWFTVEGFAPYLEVSDRASFDRFGFEALFRSEWARSWAIPGSIEPLHDDHLRRDLPVPNPRFGVQRFHVRVELVDARQPLVPVQRVSSPGAAALRPGAEDRARVVVPLDGRLEPISRVFGLTQLDPTAEAPDDVVADVEALVGAGLVFTRGQLEMALGDVDWEGRADWPQDSLDGSLRWGYDVAAGDIVAVEDRWVVLYRDENGDGGLDDGDTCLDFVKGAIVAPLVEVFPGVGLVSLGTRSGATSDTAGR